MGRKRRTNTTLLHDALIRAHVLASACEQEFSIAESPVQHRYFARLGERLQELHEDLTRRYDAWSGGSPQPLADTAKETLHKLLYGGDQVYLAAKRRAKFVSIDVGQRLAIFEAVGPDVDETGIECGVRFHVNFSRLHLYVKKE